MPFLSSQASNEQQCIILKLFFVVKRCSFSLCVVQLFVSVHRLRSIIWICSFWIQTGQIFMSLVFCFCLFITTSNIVALRQSARKTLTGCVILINVEWEFLDKPMQKCKWELKKFETWTIFFQFWELINHSIGLCT